MVKLLGYPRRPASRRRMRTHAEWKVITHIALAVRSPSSRSMRSLISAAALLVKVIASTSPGRTPRSASRYAMRWVRTRVLPDPAPATISSGPPWWSTAVRWGSLRPSRSCSWEDTPPRVDAGGRGCGPPAASLGRNLRKRRLWRISVRVFIDCDPGIDDALALAYLAADSSVEIVGVGTVYGNAAGETTTDNAVRLLRLFGRPDVPVSAGAARPLVQQPRLAAHVHGANGLGGIEVPAAERIDVSESAAEALVRLARSAPGQISVLALGPLTNLALALAL